MVKIEFDLQDNASVTGRFARGLLGLVIHFELARRGVHGYSNTPRGAASRDETQAGEVAALIKDYLPFVNARSAGKRDHPATRQADRVYRTPETPPPEEPEDE